MKKAKKKTTRKKKEEKERGRKQRGKVSAKKERRYRDGRETKEHLLKVQRERHKRVREK